jgi:hypothetical protein
MIRTMQTMQMRGNSDCGSTVVGCDDGHRDAARVLLLQWLHRLIGPFTTWEYECHAEPVWQVNGRSSVLMSYDLCLTEV